MSILHALRLNICTGMQQLLPAQPCVLCGDMGRDGSWCAACDRSLPYLDAPHCPRCALPVPTGELCGKCLSHPPSFDRTRALFGYVFPLDKLIQRMKYGEQLALAHTFAQRLAQRIPRSGLPDCLIAMPLHPAKLRARGYNQSLLLARQIARELKVELLPDACRRTRDTPPQSTLPWKERARNVRNAFRCERDLDGKHVALVDDVLTTGASLGALADAVRQRGAADISAWVVARTLPHRPNQAAR